MILEFLRLWIFQCYELCNIGIMLIIISNNENCFGVLSVVEHTQGNSSRSSQLNLSSKYTWKSEKESEPNERAYQTYDTRHSMWLSTGCWRNVIWLARFRLSIRSYAKEANILQMSRDNIHSNIYPPWCIQQHKKIVRKNFRTVAVVILLMGNNLI